METVREVHDYLLRHMDKRITIEELSQKYLMNPTTLKAVFKEVYGESLASHMKEHRMESASALPVMPVPDSNSGSDWSNFAKSMQIVIPS